MEHIHSLLKRQLKRCFGDNASIPDEWQEFIRMVNEAYQESDIDREMLERSLDLSSQELLEANSQMRSVFQAIPDLLFRIDCEGIILDVKAGATDDFLLQPGELLGKHIQNVPLPSVKDQFHDAIQQVRQERSMVSIEYSFMVQDQECFYEARMVPLLDTQIIVIIRNITTRKQMEQALRRAHDELEERIKQRTLELQHANEQLAALYKIGKTITAPLQLRVVLDEIVHSTANLLGTDTGVILLLDENRKNLTIEGAYGLSETVVKGTHDHIGESIAGRVVQTGQPIIANDLLHDPRFYNPSASHEGLLACASVPLIVGGRIIGTLDVHSKSDPHAFTEAHVRTLTMLAGQAAIAIENARLYEQLQLAHDELEERVQQRTAELLAANTRLQQEIVERQRAEEALRTLNEELELRVDARTSELKNANAALQESLETIQRAQDQLVQSEKMAALGSLVAGIAHEVNTPIGIGVTAASHLDEHTREITRQYHAHSMTRTALEAYLHTATESVAMLLANLRRAAELIQNFKQVAVDRTSEEKRRFRLKDYIDAVLVSLGPRLKRTPYTVTVQCPEDLKIESYPGAFSQILTNFVMNSLEHAFSPDMPGEMHVHIREESGMLSIRYSDNGKGMSPQECSRVFEPFYTTKRDQGGSGLGLSIVYNLVTQTLNGTIRCESQVGNGTTFLLHLPVT